MKGKTDYFKPNTEISNYIPLPRFILTEDVTTSAKLIYGLLVARTMLSQKAENRQAWTDKAGRTFIRYPIQNLAEDSGLGRSTVSSALSELKQEGLIKTKRSGCNQANRIYVKYIPDSFQKNSQDQIPASRTTENRNSGCQNPAPIYTDKDKQKKIMSPDAYRKIHNFDERTRTSEEWEMLEEMLFNV